MLTPLSIDLIFDSGVEYAASLLDPNQPEELAITSCRAATGTGGADGLGRVRARLQAGCGGNSKRCQELLDRAIHCLTHFGHNCGYASLVYLSGLGRGVGPHCLAGTKVCHLRGKRDLNPDPTFLVHLFELFQPSAQDEIHIRTPVINLDLGEPAGRTQTVRDRIGQKFARVDCPAMIIIKSDLFW